MEHLQKKHVLYARAICMCLNGTQCTTDLPITPRLIDIGRLIGLAKAHIGMGIKRTQIEAKLVPQSGLKHLIPK